MRLIIYLADGSREETVNHERIVASGAARYANEREQQEYEAHFERCDYTGHNPET